VLFDELGWVAFDPLPKSDEPPRPVEEDFTPKPSTPPTSEPPPASETPSASAPPLAQAPVAGGSGPPAVLVATGASGSVLLVLLAAAGTVVMMRRGLRQRRLGAGAPDERITGAWLEFTDALRLSGRPVPAHLAATEAAVHAAQPPVPRQRRTKELRLRRGDRHGVAGEGEGRTKELRLGRGDRHGVAGEGEGRDDAGRRGRTGVSGGGGPVAVDAGWRPEDAPSRGGAGPVRAAAPPAGFEMPPLDELTAAVNVAAFAPGAADGQQAERAGQQAVAYAEALRARRSWWRRLWWSLHPGPLRWHRD
jgi:hypothetical protein